MEVIPVIDLMDGRAVGARAGERSGYRPLETPLCPDGRPETLLRRLLERFAFPRIYLADLDAIRGGPRQEERIQALRRAFPAGELWVDAGVRDEDALGHLLREGVTPVLGSETLPDAGLLEAGRGRGEVVLSLDYRGEAFQGPPALDRAPDAWPDRVVVMTLGRVGMARGPDFPALKRVRRLKPSAGVYAAGGVRDSSDLRRLAEEGMDGALVATALHQGRLADWLDGKS